MSCLPISMLTGNAAVVEILADGAHLVDFHSTPSFDDEMLSHKVRIRMEPKPLLISQKSDLHVPLL